MRIVCLYLFCGQSTRSNVLAFRFSQCIPMQDRSGSKMLAFVTNCLDFNCMRHVQLQHHRTTKQNMTRTPSEGIVRDLEIAPKTFSGGTSTLQTNPKDQRPEADTRRLELGTLGSFDRSKSSTHDCQCSRCLEAGSLQSPTRNSPRSLPV